MQFRTVKTRHASTVQAIRTTYDPARKRGVQKVVGTFSKYDDRLNREAFPDMTDEEFAQAEAHLKALKTATDRVLAAHNASMLPEHMDALSAILTGSDDDLRAAVLARVNGAATWAAIETLTKALRKAGVAKPEKAKAAAEPQPAPLLDGME